ncbi:thioredoxin [Ruminiclostridium josui]|uniref:thioredoxin n=1 Tax=Ruminiclostridium josui TaxID=1499 RepID=UPI00046617E5|nr:thioredoxin [Ruminiclostridium josui]
MVTVFTDENFEKEVLESSIPVLVDFYSNKCAPCKLILSVVDEISCEYEGELKVGKVNVEENRATWAVYGIKALPTVLLFKKGEVAEKVIGAVQKDIFIEKINLVLESET